MASSRDSALGAAFSEHDAVFPDSLGSGPLALAQTVRTTGASGVAPTSFSTAPASAPAATRAARAIRRFSATANPSGEALPIVSEARRRPVSIEAPEEGSRHGSLTVPHDFPKNRVRLRVFESGRPGLRDPHAANQ